MEVVEVWICECACCGEVGGVQHGERACSSLAEFAGTGCCTACASPEVTIRCGRQRPSPRCVYSVLTGAAGEAAAPPPWHLCELHVIEQLLKVLYCVSARDYSSRDSREPFRIAFQLQQQIAPNTKQAVPPAQPGIRESSYWNSATSRRSHRTGRRV